MALGHFQLLHRSHTWHIPECVRVRAGRNLPRALPAGVGPRYFSQAVCVAGDRYACRIRGQLRTFLCALPLHNGRRHQRRNRHGAGQGAQRRWCQLVTVTIKVVLNLREPGGLGRELLRHLHVFTSGVRAREGVEVQRRAAVRLYGNELRCTCRVNCVVHNDLLLRVDPADLDPVRDRRAREHADAVHALLDLADGS